MKSEVEGGGEGDYEVRANKGTSARATICSCIETLCRSRKLVDEAFTMAVGHLGAQPPGGVVAAANMASPRHRAELGRGRLVAPHGMRDPLRPVASSALVQQVEARAQHTELTERGSRICNNLP